MPASDTSSSPRPEALLDGPLAAWEDEVIECKHAENSYIPDKLGKYFSALRNVAALRGIQSAWKMLGIEDRSRNIVGTRAFSRPGQLNDLKQKIAEHSSTKGTFRDIHEVLHPDARVLMLEIPAAPRGQAVAWKGHAYGRSGESLGALPLDKLDELRGHDPRGDWTAQTVPDAKIADLYPAAPTAARDGFSSQHSIPRDGIDGWPNDEFLARAATPIRSPMSDLDVAPAGHAFGYAVSRIKRPARRSYQNGDHEFTIAAGHSRSDASPT